MGHIATRKTVMVPHTAVVAAARRETRRFQALNCSSTSIPRAWAGASAGTAMEACCAWCEGAGALRGERERAECTGKRRSAQ